MKYAGVAVALLATAVCSSCGGEATVGEGVRAPVTAPVVNPAPPVLKLPAIARPTRAAATLSLSPDDPVIRGVIDIDLELLGDTDVLWLDGSDLVIQAAHLEQGGATMAARVVPGGQDFVGFAFAKAAAKGPARMHVEYTAKVVPNDDHAVFRVEEDGLAYLFTQFENIDARRAFPCFDEPGYKHPWQISLRVKTGLRALSNTMPASEEANADGTTTVHFAETKPLPSYLVAFAVGPFDLVDGGKTKSGTPVRIATPKGKQAEAAYAAANTAKIIDQLEDYFGVPYAYGKMDIVPVPRLASFGAMENAGMITIGMSLALAKREEQTPVFERNYFTVAAHELAHQWFGDLVTMAWWDDVWLNEAFATWMEYKIPERVHPEWQMGAARVFSLSGAAYEDGLSSARKIRQEIVTKDDIQNAFDDITYDKGGAVIGMFEQYVGASAFQQGIHAYIEKHAGSNATSADFLTDVSAGAKRDMKAAFSTFLDQAGVPVVKATLACDKAGARLDLSQERYVPLGSRAAPATWQVPVCVKYGGAKGAPAVACTMLTDKTGTLALPSCPQYVMPKPDGVGYYRVATDKKTLANLLGAHKKDLTTVERVAVVDNAAALVTSGGLPVGDALALLPDLGKETDATLLRVAATLTYVVHVPDELRPAYARFLDGVLGAAAKRIGWRAHPGDSAVMRGTRTLLVPLVAVRGEDAALLAEAKELASKWLDDPSALDVDAVDGVLSAACAYGDRALFDRMRAEAKRTKDDNRRTRIIRAMPHFRDPAVLRDVYGLLLSDDFDVRDTFAVLLYSDYFSQDTQIAYALEHFDALVARIPEQIRPEIFAVGAGICADDKRAAFEANFKDKTAKITGGPRRFEQVLEGVDTCIAQKKAMQPSLTAFLKK